MRTIMLIVMPFALAVIACIIGIAVGNPAVGIGGGALVFVICFVVVICTLVKRGVAKTWDGEVVELYCASSDEGPDSYVIVCRTDVGKKRKVQDPSGHALFDYLEVGDRVRFHPRLNYPLEKYDKTRDSVLVCPFCGTWSKLDAVACERREKPLLR